MRLLKALAGIAGGSGIAAVIAAVLGYWQSGAVVGVGGGVGVHGWAAGLIATILGAIGGGGGLYAWNPKLPTFTKKSVSVPVTPDAGPNKAELTEETSRSILFFRTLLINDAEAQVFLDELLVRSMRVASGMSPEPDYKVAISKSGGVTLTPKQEE